MLVHWRGNTTGISSGTCCRRVSSKLTSRDNLSIDPIHRLAVLWLVHKAVARCVRPLAVLKDPFESSTMRLRNLLVADWDGVVLKAPRISRATSSLNAFLSALVLLSKSCVSQLVDGRFNPSNASTTLRVAPRYHFELQHRA